MIKALGRVEPKRGEVYQNGLGYANEEEVEIAAVSVFASWMPILYVLPPWRHTSSTGPKKQS